MSATVDKLLDQLAMLQMGNNGNTEAHIYLEDVARSPLRNAEECHWHCTRRGARFFIPPKEQDRVIMFTDNSGVYVHSDGFCTPMGANISHEVGAWQETR